MRSSPKTDERSDARSCVKRLKILADETRMAVIEELLRRGPRNVTQIFRALKIPQSLLSHHLSVLRKAGLVASERQGKAILYRVSDAVRRGGGSHAVNLGCCELNFRERRRREAEKEAL